MNRKLMHVCAGLGMLTMAAVGARPANGQQTEELKPKPAMYTYTASWVLARKDWGEWETVVASEQKTMDNALADGSIAAFGDSKALIHVPGAYTHGSWWTSMSMAGSMKTLDQLLKAVSKSPVLDGAMSHGDSLIVSRFYNRHAGTVKGGYLHGASYQLKADAPDNALETLEKNIVAPLLEKLLADGSISAYQIATEAIHTLPPGTFFIYYISPDADGLDKVNAALARLSNSMSLSMFDSMTDPKGHGDVLFRSNSTFK